MVTLLISILGALGAVILITVLGLILAKIFINRADKVQAHTNTLAQQLLAVVVDIDELPEAEQNPGISVISNDVIDGTSRGHYHLAKKTISVIDQDAPLRTQNASIHQTYVYKDPAILTKTDGDAKSSTSSRINPLTDKITLDY